MPTGTRDHHAPSRPLSSGGSFGLAVLLALSACEAPEPSATDSVVRDSAGVRIVENPDTGPEAASDWQLDPEPQARMGAVDGSPGHQLHLVRAGVRLSDGRIVILNGSTEELRYFAPDGSHLASAGGSGDGPGEFVRTTEIRRGAGDTVLVWDAGSRSLNRFDPEGGFVGRLAVPYETLGPELGPDQVVNVFSLLPDGSVLLRGRAAQRLASLGWDRPRWEFARAHPDDGAGLTPLGSYGGLEHFNVRTEDRPLLRSVPYFARTTHVAAGGDPMRIYVAGMEGDGATPAGPDGYGVRVFRPDGTLERIVRHRIPARSPSDDEVDQVREAERRSLEAAPFERPEGYIEEQLRSLPIPETLPPHGEIFVDSRGTLWVQQWEVLRADRRRYAVFDPEGHLVARVTLPPDLRILEVGPDWVLGVWRDEQGVEFVHLHALHRPA